MAVIVLLCVSSTHCVRHMKHIARFVERRQDNSRAPVDRSVDAIARESGRRGQSTPPKKKRSLSPCVKLPGKKPAGLRSGPPPALLWHGQARLL